MRLVPRTRSSIEAQGNAREPICRWKMIRSKEFVLLVCSRLLLALFCAKMVSVTMLAEERCPIGAHRLPQRAKTNWTDDQLYGPYKGMSAKELWRERDAFFKSGKVPTDSNEVQRLWQWHRAMDNADPAFGIKVPIEFYGKVIDQYGKPVPAATVDLSWGQGTNRLMKTLADGTFSFGGVKGPALGVTVLKEGYLENKVRTKHFNYADFFAIDFHLPNPAKPVLFRLQKLENPEPMYVWTPSVQMDVKGSVIWFDAGTGKQVEAGDIGFSVVRDDYPGKRESGYVLNLVTPPGGGVVVTNEEYMFLAPETGYRSAVVIPHRPTGSDDQAYHPTMEITFYLRTPDARYAAVETTVIQRNAPAARVDCIFYFNPSGSRNLELGVHNRLDPAKVKPANRGPAPVINGAVIEQK